MQRIRTGQPKRMNRIRSISMSCLVALAAGSVTGCRETEDALTAHARPVATVSGQDLSTRALGRLMAEAPIPDSMLTTEIAEQIARLWADYVTLATIYMEPDSTRTIDFAPLLDDGRYYASLAVQRYRDSIVAANSDPTEEEVREYFETNRPFTRLDLRRIVIPVPADASEEVRDSLFAEASELRDRLAGGADFVEVARARSSDPPGQRGIVLSFQGREDLPLVAHGPLFQMRPGEISPVFATGEAMLIYRVEQVRTPEYSEARDLTLEWMVEERTEAAQVQTADSLLSAAQRAVTDGAPEAALEIASQVGMAEGTIPGSTALVRYVGGALTAEDLRSLFRVRMDLRNRFAAASEAEVEEYLLELAADEVLVQAAEAGGFGPTPEEREELQELMADRLAEIATQYNITRKLVTGPDYRIGLASESLIRGVMAARRGVPWLTDYRYVLDPAYPATIYERGAETAARLAQDLRTAAAAPAPASEPEPEDGAATPVEDDGAAEAVGHETPDTEHDD